MIDFIKPMIIFDYSNNDNQFEYQQNIISKLIYAPFCNDPFEQFEMFKILKDAFFYFAKDNNKTYYQLTCRNHRRYTYFLPNVVSIRPSGYSITVG